MSRERLIYTLLHVLALPFILVRLWWRGFAEHRYRKNIDERFGHLDLPRIETVDDNGRLCNKLIWIHAVSVGETRAAYPIVLLLRQQLPDHAILLTHMTPTGRRTGKALFRDETLRAYLPYDVPFAVGRFLEKAKPRFGIIMETEIWPNLIAGCKARNIPLFLVNGRLSERSLTKYLRAEKLAREAVTSLTGIAAQTRADADRLRSLGAQNMVVTGNIKFDFQVSDQSVGLGDAMRQTFGDERGIWVAGSTREGEEAMLLDAIEAVGLPQGALTIIVPRHPQRFDEVASLLQERGLPFVRRSDNIIVPRSINFVLGDSMGEMFSYYSAAHVVLMGGSFKKLGGQNLIEPLAVGRPVIVGPHTYNFSEATELAIEAGAAVRVDDTEGAVRAVGQLLTDRDTREAMGHAGLTFAEANRGAVHLTLDWINKQTGVLSRKKLGIKLDTDYDSDWSTTRN
jgi:3-deoxy-D-manno-octulosonic-acid transferase